jgi:uncharacterized protein YigE (DUF2233 family)
VKKALLLIILIIGAWFAVNNSKTLQVNQTVSITPTPIVYKTVSLGEEIYGYELFLVRNTGGLKLISNYSQKSSTEDLIQENSCNEAINGGFYAQNDSALGLVISAGNQLSGPINSSLLNGYFSINRQGMPRIDYREYYNDFIGLQSGPILYISRKPVDLRLTDDKTSRRMIAAITTGGQVYFVTVFNTQAEILGPRLDDLPLILEVLSEKENIDLESAINLDGGRASAFYSPELKLSEVTWVGSLFCTGAPNESI